MQEELPDVIEKMPGCHQGGAALYQLMSKSKHDALVQID